MTGELAKALAAFQQEMPIVAKTKTANVGQYSYTYADLADITEQAMPLLTKHNLAFSTCPRMTEHGYELVGRLLHESGETLEGALPIQGKTPQDWGSSITYMRRYLFGCMTGLVTDDDDDGRMAAKAATPSRGKASDGKATQAQLAKIGAAMSDLGMTDRALALAYVTDVIGRPIESRNDLTKTEASKVIESLERDIKQPFGEGGSDGSQQGG